MNWKERGPERSVGSGQEGSWRGLAKGFGAAAVGCKYCWDGQLGTGREPLDRRRSADTRGAGAACQCIAGLGLYPHPPRR